MKEQTITVSRNWANMQDLGAKLASRFGDFMADVPCPVCGFVACKCAEISRQKLYRERAQWEKQEQERKKSAEIERLGGVRAYEDFTAEKYTNKQLLQALSNYPQENYYLWGKAGTGKTHAAVAIIRNCPGAIVKRMSEISREIRTSEAEDEETIIDRYAYTPMLLDDLGSEKATEFLQNMLFEIMDRRWQSKQGGLIITANMSIDKLGTIIGDRTASRIAGLVGSKNTIEISGTDWRLK